MCITSDRFTSTILLSRRRKRRKEGRRKKKNVCISLSSFWFVERRMNTPVEIQVLLGYFFGPTYFLEKPSLSFYAYIIHILYKRTEKSGGGRDDKHKEFHS